MRGRAVRSLLCALAAAVFLAACSLPADRQAAAPTAVKTKESAAAAIKRKDPDGRFEKLHRSFIDRGKAGPIGLLFVGDSITQNWTKAPQVWKDHFERYRPANFGIGGDRTQHLLWRLENGELEGIAPQVVVLLIGTNNSADYGAEQIAAADTKIVQLIRAKIPRAKVLVLGIFPRGNRSGESVQVTARRMEAIRGANAELGKLDDGENVRFLDIGPAFVDGDGKIPASLMPDQLHPSAEGYRVWAQAMQPTLESMMK